MSGIISGPAVVNNLLNANFNHVSIYRGVDLHNSSLVNVSSINGFPYNPLVPVISNIKEISSQLIIQCDSITTNNLFFKNNFSLVLSGNSSISQTLTSTIPSLVIANKTLNLYIKEKSTLASSSTIQMSGTAILN